MTFGELLRSERTRARCSLRKCAAGMGVSITYLSCVERGELAPFAPDRIKRVAAFLGVDATPLLDAAVATRGVAKLDAVHVSDKHREVGAILAREWATLTTEQLDAIARVIAPT